MLGTLVRLDSNLRPIVVYANQPDKEIMAISVVPIDATHTRRQLILSPIDGNPENPVILGIVQNPLMDILERQAATETRQGGEVGRENPFTQADVLVDNNRIVINAREEIVFKCGDASITLTKSGKVLVRGKYVLSRSAGVNRILGGSVQVN